CAVDGTGAFRTNKELTVEPYAAHVAGTVRSASYDPSEGVYRLAYRAAQRGPRVTELSLPPGTWHLTADAAVARTAPGRAWVVAAPGAEVTVTVRRG
ncbi:MAG TPA: endoglycoceramidase, partial [Streptomyces sp.]|nr:endoglycoceramidase [Streptomyces sp.]